MAKRLNEELVFRKTKLNNLTDIKKLNCWGNDIEDVSLLQQMPNVQVLSLSINKINTLANFQYCTSLQELYVRQNDIRDLNEICYLQGLKNLRNLWLAENPCSLQEDYRPTVIRTLTQLKQLDNLAITEREYKEAATKGRLLIHPDNLPRRSYTEETPEKEEIEIEIEIPKENEFYMSNSMNYVNKNRSSEENCCNQNSPNYNNQNSPNYNNQNSPNYNNQIKEEIIFKKMKNCSTNRSSEDNSKNTTYRPSSPPTYRLNNNFEDECFNSIRCSFEDQNDYNAITSLTSYHITEERDNDTFSVKDHYVEESYSCRPSNTFHQAIIQPLNEISYSYVPPLNHSFSSNDLEDSLESNRLQKSQSTGLIGQETNTGSFIPIPRREDSNNSMLTEDSHHSILLSQPTKSLNNSVVSENRKDNIREKSAKKCRRLKNTTKTANVLSAVLCLLKELDLSSLEVVEMVVASRLDELEGIS
ncbi:probable serine/threonine-protein kinase DDB_G0278845 [Agrilus planipennis]|uniref:Probable serine/threonine-protein kinase DDB_G0278845 n=1 Tax=Agrilus planipennis TaxID=224129 RepID=A0A1W4WMQ3_AGRPL|nr:probable serine/threonine-protein kinase DDB_G0278845 [Agrilus planipennis]